MDYFDIYTSQFNLNDKNEKMKYDHSYRVQKINEALAKNIKLNDENIYLASIIGLLHDIGRFEQLRITSSYSDLEGFDHANYGVKILFDNNLIDKFDIDNKYYQTIKSAIKNHNKYEIEDHLVNEELIQNEMIRDSDKVDILNIIANIDEFKFVGDLEKLSPAVIEEFVNKKSVHVQNLKTRADKLLQIWALVFDIKYDYCIYLINDNKYIDIIYDCLKDKDYFKKYYDIVKKYIKERMN